MFNVKKSASDPIATPHRRLRSASSKAGQTIGGHEATLDEAATVAEFIGSFARTVDGMEQRFVPLGEDLGNIVSHLQVLAQSAGNGFGAIRQEISTGALGELEVRAGASLSVLKQQLADMATRIQPLAEVADDLYRLHSLANDVQRIGASLRACGSIFAIESARREDTRSAFSAFVQELRKLAAEIGGLAERMENDSRETLLRLNSTRRRIAGNLGELEDLAFAMQGAFATAASEIQQFLAGMRGVLERVERHRAAITQQTHGVVYYLQFGDLVRQQCEHVLAAAIEAEDAAKSPATGMLTIIVRTVAAQVELIEREVDEARGHLSEGYAGLQCELVQLAECAQALKGSGDANSRDAWSGLKARLQELETVQKKEAKLNADVVRASIEAGGAAATLRTGLDGGGEISSHLHLLAVNAIIQAVQLGENGSTLEKLAQHVDGLNRTCATVVPQVLALLEGIANRVGASTGDVEEKATLDLGATRQLEQAQQRGASVMEEVLGLATTGEAMLRAAVARLATLDSLSAEIGAHRVGLVRFADRLPKTSAASATLDEFDARMEKCYTMQSERDAHRLARGLKTSAAAVTSVEFFSPADDSADPDAALATATSCEGDLGDNFELF